MTFSGGGTRAAAFSYGVLQGFDETRVDNGGRAMSLLDQLDFVSGVSGGSVLAAYYGLKKRAAMTDFKQRFLLANGEEALQTDLSFLNLAKGLSGGINDTTGFPRWLDAHLFGGATFKDMTRGGLPEVWINASDIYNRTAFIFADVTFRALCSDLANYPLSLAVAASAAVPVVFAPVVIQNYPGGCPAELPPWVERVRNDDTAAPLIRAYADALERYRTGDIKYVKLLDGGIVDNYGLAGFTISLLAANAPYGPLSPREAVKLRRLLFHGGRFRPRSVRDLGADRRRAGRRRSHQRHVRYRHGLERHRQLHLVRHHHGPVAQQSGELALPSLRSRARPPRRAAGMELQGREILCRPRFVRSIGPGSLGRAQRRRDAAQAAAGSGRPAD